MVRIEQFELRAPQVVALRLPRAGVIRVNDGRLWLTRHGGLEDVWLQAREHWTAEVAVTVWLSAEPAADFQIARPAASLPMGLAAFLRRRIQLGQRLQAGPA